MGNPFSRRDWKRAARRAGYTSQRGRPVTAWELAAWGLAALLILAAIIGLWGGR